MKKGILGFLAVVVIIALVVVTAAFGLNLGVTEIPAAVDGIRLGLDLKGGAMITFEARTENGADPTREEMEIAQTVLRRRLDAENYTEATVQIVGTKRLSVEIPSVKNAEAAVELLGQTAVLEFRDADGNVVLTGSDIEDAAAIYGQTSDVGPNEHYVSLTFKSEARAKFAEATKKAAAAAGDNKNYIDIYLDDALQSRPFVDASYSSTGINSDSCIITMGNPGDGTSVADAAQTLANIINSGRLPFDLEEIELRMVGPTLGEKALEISLFAGLLGLILVMIFMIAVYRLPGIVASLSLIFYTALIMVVMAVLNVNLSLPGIAGIILSIGMAVDANVIIYERIKEELRLGKTIKASIDAGFKRAFAAIIDSNVTTLIAAVVLYFYGMGTVVGFAITLGIGVIVSMFTVLVVSRFLLYRLVDMNIKSLKAYGA